MSAEFETGDHSDEFGHRSGSHLFHHPRAMICSVTSLMRSSAAACLFSRPLATSVSTSRSRGVSDDRRSRRSANSARLRLDSRLCARAESRGAAASRNVSAHRATLAHEPLSFTDTRGLVWTGHYSLDLHLRHERYRVDQFQRPDHVLSPGLVLEKKTTLFI